MTIILHWQSSFLLHAYSLALSIFRVVLHVVKASLCLNIYYVEALVNQFTRISKQIVTIQSFHILID